MRKNHMLLLMLLFSCNEQTNKNVPSNNIILPSKKQSDIVLIQKADTIRVKKKSQMTGNWIELGKENLTVKIDHHSFYYPEHRQKLKYEFINDTVTIFYYDVTYGGKPYIINDTLLFINKDNYCLKLIRKK